MSNAYHMTHVTFASWNPEGQDNSVWRLLERMLMCLATTDKHAIALSRG
jgi:hypothetical protein